MEFKLGILNFNKLMGYKKKKKKTLRFYDLQLVENNKEKYVLICNFHLLLIKKEKKK